MRTVATVALLFALVVGVTACGGGEETRPRPERVEGTVEEEQRPALAQGNARAGRQVFLNANPSCGSCHAFNAAGTNATTGPNLDESLADENREDIYEDITNPSAEIEDVYSDIMPKEYGEKLSDRQLADLVAFLTPKK